MEKVTAAEQSTTATQTTPTLQKEIRWSYSRISEYKQCPFKYKLHYVDGHYVNTDSIATRFGTAIHEAEEIIANNIKANEPIDYVKLKNQYILKNIQLKEKYFKDWYSSDKSNRTYEEKMYLYLDTSIYRLQKYMEEHPTYRIVGAEIPIDFLYKGTKRFRGSIDRLIYDEATGEYIMQDIKSWPRIDEHATDECVTPLQFVVYTLAASEMYNVPVEKIKCQYDLPLAPGGGGIYDAGTKGYLTRGTKKLDKLFDGIYNLDYTPNPSPLCHWCQFCPTNPNQPYNAKQLCPYYSKWTPEKPMFAVACEWQGMEQHGVILENYIGEGGE